MFVNDCLLVFCLSFSAYRKDNVLSVIKTLNNFYCVNGKR